MEIIPSKYQIIHKEEYQIEYIKYTPCEKFRDPKKLIEYIESEYPFIKKINFNNSFVTNNFESLLLYDRNINVTVFCVYPIKGNLDINVIFNNIKTLLDSDEINLSCNCENITDSMINLMILFKNYFKINNYNRNYVFIQQNVVVLDYKQAEIRFYFSEKNEENELLVGYNGKIVFNEFTYNLFNTGYSTKFDFSYINKFNFICYNKNEKSKIIKSLELSDIQFNCNIT